MPAEPKLTRWFKWPTKPTLEGWYDVRWSSGSLIRRLWWDGEHFCPDPHDILGGYGFYPGDQWRGLAEKPR